MVKFGGGLYLLDDRCLISQLTKPERLDVEIGQRHNRSPTGGRNDQATVSVALLLASKHMGRIKIPLESALRRPNPLLDLMALGRVTN
jgi:hypothetical protein